MMALTERERDGAIKGAILVACILGEGKTAEEFVNAANGGNDDLLRAVVIIADEVAGSLGFQRKK